MKENNIGIRFLYGTKIGNKLLSWILDTCADVLVVEFLQSPFSKICIPFYIKKHRISTSEFRGQKYKSFAEFFARRRADRAVDQNPRHLISPCDGWLSAYPIEKDSRFSIKGFQYQLQDLMGDSSLGAQFEGGMCLSFRLCASDYHHYCYIDDGFQEKHHYISGELHSVQPLACEKYPVYTLNRREWSLLKTENFGPVIQTEIGALVVGGIVNEKENTQVKRGMEKGHFELSGSTIVLLFTKNQVELMPYIQKQLAEGQEYRVKQGMWIGNGKEK